MLFRLPFCTSIVNLKARKVYISHSCQGIESALNSLYQLRTCGATLAHLDVLLRWCGSLWARVFCWLVACGFFSFVSAVFYVLFELEILGLRAVLVCVWPFSETTSVSSLFIVFCYLLGAIFVPRPFCNLEVAVVETDNW